MAEGGGIFSGMGAPDIGTPGEPPKDPSVIAQRAKEITDFLKQPEVMSGLLQFGAQVTQPRAPGQSQLGAITQAVAAGGEAAARAGQAQRTQEAAQAAADREQQQIDLAERRTEVAEAAEGRQAETVSRRLSILENAEERQRILGEAQTQLAQDRLGFQRQTQEVSAGLQRDANDIRRLQAEIAQEGNEIRRASLMQEKELAEMRQNAAAEQLATRIAAEHDLKKDVASLSLITALAKAEIQNSFITQAPVDINRIVEQARTATQAASQFNEPATQTATPSGAPSATPSSATGTPLNPTSGTPFQGGTALSRFDPAKLTINQKNAIFSSPEREQAARNTWGDEVVDRLKGEITVE